MASASCLVLDYAAGCVSFDVVNQTAYDMHYTFCVKARSGTMFIPAPATVAALSARTIILAADELPYWFYRAPDTYELTVYSTRLYSSSPADTIAALHLRSTQRVISLVYTDTRPWGSRHAPVFLFVVFLCISLWFFPEFTCGLISSILARPLFVG